ncbi:MAG: hypothetical protein ACYTGU_21395 [Planctomycetota bacterium]|jgi:ATP-dependent Lon protease
MLRHDVVDACSEGKFHVYAVETVHEAIELLTGRPAGIRDAQGNYTEGCVLALAVTRAHEYWLKAAAPRPGSPPQEQENNESESGGGTRPA